MCVNACLFRLGDLKRWDCRLCVCVCVCVDTCVFRLGGLRSCDFGRVVYVCVYLRDKINRCLQLTYWRLLLQAVISSFHMSLVSRS